jgi:hypothetical protein
MSAKKSPKSGSEGKGNTKELSKPSNREDSEGGKEGGKQPSNGPNNSVNEARGNVNFLMRVCRTKSSYKGFLQQLVNKSEDVGGNAIKMAVGIIYLCINAISAGGNAIKMAVGIV